jgi:hypothetical protein
VSEGSWVSIVDWEKEYQHYDPEKRLKDPRGPMPWIKNYTRLMQNDEYLELTEHCALILHRLWLVYASSGCRLRADTRSLSRKTGLRVTKSHLELLNHAGFIDIVASRELAEGYIPGSTRATRDRSSGSDRTSQVEDVVRPHFAPSGSDSEHETKSTSEEEARAALARLSEGIGRPF